MRLGFHDTWVGWIRMCVESVAYSVQENQDHAGPIISARGLRQGDPLSPYLYILCAQGLSVLIHDAQRKGDLHGVNVCHLLP